MAKKNIKDHFDKLKALGKKKGYLTYEEINDSLPEDIISADQIERVFSALDNEEIQIVDSEQEYKARKKENAAPEKSKEDIDKDSGDHTSQDVSVGIEDPVKMYLRQMGQIPLLSREEEIR